MVNLEDAVGWTEEDDLVIAGNQAQPGELSDDIAVHARLGRNRLGICRHQLTALVGLLDENPVEKPPRPSGSMGETHDVLKSTAERTAAAQSSLRKISTSRAGAIPPLRGFL